MSKKIEKSTCPICGKKFVKKVNNQVYCCIKCKKVAKKNAAKAKNENKTEKQVARKIVENVKLTKPVEKKFPDTAIIVKGNDPFKIFAIASIIRDKAMAKILSKTKLINSGKCRKAK